MAPKFQKSSIFFLAFVFLAFFITTPLWAQGRIHKEYGSSYIADELLIQVKAGVQKGKIVDALKLHGASIEDELPQLRIKRIKVPAHAKEIIKNALKGNTHIEFVEDNFLAEGSAVPNDLYYSSQWHLPKISAPEAWGITTGSNDEPIAIIDSGVDLTHPDLINKLIPGYNFLSENTDTHDVLGHGTAVAGVAAALSNNLEGVSGVAWENPIMPLVVLNSSNYATYYNIARAITYAVDRGVRVINISIGGSSYSSTLQNAVNYAWNKGAVIFASAMNNGTSNPYYPAACQNVLAISATTSGDERAGWSNYGNWIDLSAPGEYILTTSNGGGYGSRSGTSFASPLVAGVAALIFSANPSLTNQEVVNILIENSDDLGPIGFDPSFGFGRVNAYRSLLKAIESTIESEEMKELPSQDTQPPVISITSPSNGSTVKGELTIYVSATDNVGISEVSLYINGSLYATATSSPYTFLWDTQNSIDGAFEIVAIAYDSSGNMARSESVWINVKNSDTIPPIVSIISPVDGSYCTKKSITISVTASDDKEIARIELYIDGMLKAYVENKTSLNWLWNTSLLSKGGHVILAKAYDPAGNVGVKTITVYKR